MRPKKVDSIALAEYISAKVGKANHLKLQKLVYYVEAYHLAYFEKSIIDDDFEAWLHGPVSRKLWDHLKPIANVYDNVRLKEDKTSEAIKAFKQSVIPEQVSFIDDVLKEFGKKDSYYLERLTHSELPWTEARKGCAPDEKCENIISKETMKRYYKQNILQ